MRPRRNRLGRAVAAVASACQYARFNEAEAQSPRKGRQIWRSDRATAGFNEAEAQSPRKGVNRPDGISLRIELQ